MSSPASPLSRDAMARREALDPTRSFLVQAPAGSGKTELLIQRYLALLPHVAEPESVVAITFTIKAAGEMQTRILAALERAASGIEPTQEHERLSHSLALRALAQDRARGWDLAHHPSRLRVQTIDSLCASIARRMPWLSRLGAPPSVTANAAPLYAEAARRTLLQIEDEGLWQHSLRTLLVHLDNHVPRVTNQLAAMLARRDQWLPIVASGGEEREQLEASFTRLVRTELERITGLFTAGQRDRLVELARTAAANVPDDSRLAVCRDLTAWPDATPAARPVWGALGHLAVTTSGTWRKPGGINSKLGFPPRTPAKDAMRDWLEELSGHDELAAALAGLPALPPATFDDRQWEVMSALLATLHLAAGQLKVLFGERGEVDFGEVAASARLALGSCDAPSDLALGLDARIEHLLVDEFQDTSASQFELLTSLASSWDASDGRTVFLVGDPMQSIYRFRQAEVSLFLRLAESGRAAIAAADGSPGVLGASPLHFLRLEANYRSESGVVEWANRAFPQVFPREQDLVTGAITYSPSIPARPAGPPQPVLVHALPGPAEEAARVVDLVREARAANPEGSIAVLVRARTHLGAIVSAFARNAIPFRALEIDPLATRSAVGDLYALTRALLHPADRIAWLTLLRAPFCGLTLTGLEALASRSGETIWDLLNRNLDALPPDDRARAQRLRDVLGAALDALGRQSLRFLVERSWCALGGPAALDPSSSLADAADYLDLLGKEERAGRLPDLDAFSTAVLRLYARPSTASGPAVEVMTIHKSKGLQFDTVILPGLGRRSRTSEQPLLALGSAPRPGGHVDRLITAIGPRGADPDPMHAYLCALDKKKDAQESARLLYVAITRARHRAQLLGSAPIGTDGEAAPARGSLLALLWPALSDTERALFTDCGAVSDAPGETPREAPRLRRLVIPWSAPALPAPFERAATPPRAIEEPSYTWVSDTLRHVGTVVHLLLERIAAEGADRFDAARLASMRPTFRARLAALGTPGVDLDAAVDRVAQALTQTLSSERGRWVLAPHTGARSEYAVTGVLHNELIRVAVDRTFLDGDGTRWIVDYKTSDHQGGDRASFLREELRRYRGQLSRYAALLETLGAPVRAGLYFPLLDEWIEVMESGETAE